MSAVSFAGTDEIAAGFRVVDRYVSILHHRIAGNHLFDGRMATARISLRQKRNAEQDHRIWKTHIQTP